MDCNCYQPNNCLLHGTTLNLRSVESDPAQLDALRDALKEARDHARRLQDIPELREINGVWNTLDLVAVKADAVLEGKEQK